MPPQGAFLDRDGVINHLVWNAATGEYESPHLPRDLQFIDGVVPELKRLMENRFSLFLVSNQPSYAKGKTSLENIKAIHSLVDSFLKKNGIIFKDYYYCYHHPQGVVADYSGPCACRKPAPFFILKACRDYALNNRESWMIGDQDIDVRCGQNAGSKTALLLYGHSESKRGTSRPDVTGENLGQVVDKILQR